MYNVRIYKNTGLNAVNIIDKPSLLNDSTKFTFESADAIDILQNIFLSSVRIKKEWGNVRDVDYCRIGNNADGYFYYFVTGVRMVAYDVAELELTPDFITSAGGIDNVEILDGIVTRCHISDDSYGAWNIEDDFLTPSEPLMLDTHTINFSNDSTVYVESSINVGAMACIGASDAYIDSENESVQVPTVIANFATTKYQMDGNTGTDIQTCLFPVTDIIKNGINRCRGLGVESAVRSQVSIPNTLVSKTTVNESASKSGDGVVLSHHNGNNTETLRVFMNTNSLQDGTWSVVVGMSGNFVDNQTTLKYEYAQVNNKRVLYGTLNKVGILTTAGNRLESNPEDTRSGDAYITIRSVADPHPNGCPYHRFKTMNGNSSKSGFFINAIKGLQWKQIPLMYSEPSGNVLNAISFENNREVADLNYNLSPTGAMSKVLGDIAGDTAMGQLATIGVGAMTGALTGGGAGAFIGGGAGAITGAIGGALTGGLNTTKTIMSYETARKQEMQQFAIQQRVTSPSISVSYDGEAYRDFYGESVIVYRYRPTPTDIARLDTILTMYGYKVNISGKDAPTNNRKYFNYIMGNLTVGGNIPKWMADGITLQIANGVRIWHTKPSSSYYNNNPISEV